MKNEKTSPRVAKIAGAVLVELDEAAKHGYQFVYCGGARLTSIDELKALCASALTQAPDRKKKAGKK